MGFNGVFDTVIFDKNDDELEVCVEYHATYGCSGSYDPDSRFFGPDEDPEVEIIKVIYKGKCIMETLSEDILETISIDAFDDAFKD